MCIKMLAAAHVLDMYGQERQGMTYHSGHPDWLLRGQQRQSHLKQMGPVLLQESFAPAAGQVCPTGTAGWHAAHCCHDARRPLATGSQQHCLDPELAHLLVAGGACLAGPAKPAPAAAAR